jgi:heme/copper-type cytochrome/quinol oxidase subunit 2
MADEPLSSPPDVPDVPAAPAAMDTGMPAAPPAPPRQLGRRDFWLMVIRYILFILGLVFLVVLVWKGSGDEGILKSLRDVETARGMITFLIAATTVGVALILALSTIINENDDLKHRFDMGKEVLTLLIGVLGTIVGFYYGASVSNGDAPPEVEMAAVAISPKEVEPGGEVTIATRVTGGEEPYTYSITFNPPADMPEIEDEPALEGGYLVQRVTIPAQGITPGTEIAFKITATDNDGHQVVNDEEGSKFVVKTPAQAQPTAQPTPSP